MGRQARVCKCNTLAKVVTCSFLGHEQLYDLELYPSILKAVERVVAQDTEIEFIFDKHNPFQFLCLAAILEARQHHPEKRLTTAFISDNSIDEDWQEHGWMWMGPFPSCAFNKTIQRPKKTAELNKLHVEWRRDKRELIDLSDFLISYEYPDLQDHYYDLYKYGMRQRGLTVINVAKDETAQAIKDSIERLTTKEQYIVQSLKNGKSYKALGDQFGVTGEAIRVKDHRARAQLRKFAWERITKESREHKRPPQTCAVVLPSKMDEVDERRFRQVVHFLIKQMGVTTFLVEHLNCHSEFVDCLLKIRGARRFRVELVTHYSDSVATTWGSTTEGFVPPFDSVINIGSEAKQLRSRYLRALMAMLKRCDFAICKSMIDSDPYIFRQIRMRKNLKVFDLGISQERVRPYNE